MNFKTWIKINESINLHSWQESQKEPNFTFAQIDAKLNVLEKMMAKEKDPKTLATLNKTYQKLIDMMPLPPTTEVSMLPSVPSFNIVKLNKSGKKTTERAWLCKCDCGNPESVIHSTRKLKETRYSRKFGCKKCKHF